MSGKWAKFKGKKPLETTLGQAPKDVVDEAHLQKPIITSVAGLTELFNLFSTATLEVKNYISCECDILYECRFCHTIFRSLANFILHKRRYCRDKFRRLSELDDTGGVITEIGLPARKKTLLPVIDKLLKRQETQNSVDNCFTEDLSPAKVNNDNDVVFVSEDSTETKENSVVLEKIEGSKEAVFQSRGLDLESTPSTSCMKTEVMEIHDMLYNNSVALDTTGKISIPETKTRLPSMSPRNLVCKECNFRFSTVKTLRFHIKYKHNKTMTVYPCPDCKHTFANAWGVYRHLYKVHRRKASQVTRMRPQIYSMRFRKDQEPPPKKNKNVVSETAVENLENQWIDNIEKDKDFQMCGGCGRRFERKAALQSHSQMCTKRLAIYNNLKEKKTSKKEIKLEKRKRKPSNALVQRYQPVKQENDNVKCNNEESDGTSEINFSNHSEIEVFTISDDSVPPDDVKPLESDIKVEEEVKSDDDEFKEYVNDDGDYVFLAKVAPYIDKNELKCLPCSDTFLSPNQLLWHMSMHFSWFRFQCSKCAFSSFNKYDCTTHAISTHGILPSYIDSIVLPIPKWKVLCASHDFIELTQEVINNNSLNAENRDIPILERQIPETIVLEDNELEDSDLESELNPPNLFPINTRPVRNRTRSVKTLQTDFVYDLGKVLNFGDKGARLKKNLK